jgi:NADH:ubiquinone oxidoreductase subunit 4 (subunit M)
MGGYALIRFNLQLLPEAHHFFAPFLIFLGVLNIIYAALTAFAQRNLKRKIAYSSVSHMGFVLIGISSFTVSGLSGAMLQMISHGLIGASLFYLTGLIYDRVQTLRLEELGGLAQSMPKVFAMFTIVALASLALPGLSGFIAELMIFLGFVTSSSYSPIFKAILTVFEAFGILLTPIYLLSMLRQVFYGLNSVAQKEQGNHSVASLSAGNHPGSPTTLGNLKVLPAIVNPDGSSLGISSLTLAEQGLLANEPTPTKSGEPLGSYGNPNLVSQDFQLFNQNYRFQDTRIFIDAVPREIFIVTTLVIPMIGIGLYPQFCLNIFSFTTDSIILRLNQFASF